MGDIPEVAIISDLKALKLYTDPLRRKILLVLSEQPLSVHQIADRLNVPFTRLYYHIRLLEKHNLIRLVESRTVHGGVEEKFYQAAAKTFLIDRTLKTLNAESRAAVVDMAIELSLESAKSDILQALEDGAIDLEQYPPHPQALLLRYGQFSLNPERAAEYQRRLLDLYAEFVQEATDEPGEKAYHIIFGLFPGQ